jgi:hypothetical protein
MQAYPIRLRGLTNGRVVSAAELETLMEADSEGEVPVARLLDLVVVDPAARRVHVSSEDGSYSASVPLEEIRRNGVITADTEGNRLRVYDGSTLCWNVKDVGELRLTATKEPDSVPGKPTH